MDEEETVKPRDFRQNQSGKFHMLKEHGEETGFVIAINSETSGRLV